MEVADNLAERNGTVIGWVGGVSRTPRAAGRTGRPAASWHSHTATLVRFKINIRFFSSPINAHVPLLSSLINAWNGSLCISNAEIPAPSQWHAKVLHATDLVR